MQKRKISNGPQQMDCSDGAQMLIDQMKEHPEEFKGYAGKFRDTLEAAQRTLHQPATATAAYQMSMRDARAIMAAAETHLFEVWLAEDVLTKLMAPKPELEPSKLYTSSRMQGKSVFPGIIDDARNQPYTEQAYSQQLNRIREEQLKLEDFKRREQQYAMRNTKPSFGF